MKVPAALALILLGCSERVVHLAPPWAEGREILIVITDELGGFARLEPRLYSGRGPIEIEAPGLDRFGIVAYAFAPGAVKPTEFRQGGPGRPLPDAELFTATFERGQDEPGLVPSGFGNPFDLRDLDPGSTIRPCDGVRVEPIAAPELTGLAELVRLPSGRIFATADGQGRPVRVVELVDDVFEERYSFFTHVPLDYGSGLGWDGQTLFAATRYGQIAALELDGTVLHQGFHDRQTDGIAAGEGIAIIWNKFDPTWRLTRSSSVPEVLPDFLPLVTAVYAVDRDLVYAANILLKSMNGAGEWILERDLDISDAIYIHGNDDQLIVWGDDWGGIQRLASDRVWRLIPLPREELTYRAYAVGRESLFALGDAHTSSFWNGTRWCSIEVEGASEFRDAEISADHRVAFVSGEGGDPKIGYLYRIELPIVP